MLLKRLSQLELAACVVLLAAVTALVFIAALMRFFGHPLTWSVDMAQLLFIWLCMLGASRAMRMKSHLGMEAVVGYVPNRYRFWIEFVSSLVILAFLVTLVVLGVQLAWLNRARTFGDSTLSYAWVTSAVPVGCGLLALSLVYNMIIAWRDRAQGRLIYTRTGEESAAPPPLEL